LLVSHDRAFVSALATRVLEVTEQGFRDFPGTYDEYLSRCGDDHLDAEAVVLKAKRDKAETPQAAAGAVSWEEQKRRNNRKKQLPQQRDEVMAAIERAETRKATIQADWAKPEFYATTDKARVAELEREEQALSSEISSLMAKWESLEAEIAGLSSP
jgi:ATPase subunit of ABC transporter with duplicated ATPase domains